MAYGVTMTDADGRTTAMGGGPLAAVRGILKANRAEKPEGDWAEGDLADDFPPFFAGLVGSFSYDLVRRFERLPSRAVDDTQLPEMDLSFHDRVIAVDHVQQRLWVTDLPTPAERAAYDDDSLRMRVTERIHATLSRLAAPTVDEGVPLVQFDAAITQQMPEARFETMVGMAKEYIAAGDIFQANLSQRFSAPMGENLPWDLYRTLSAINPAPFACYMDMGDYQIVSSSPERLVSLAGERVEARPIAGTRPRTGDQALDTLSGEELLAHPKERAEHVMLVDLMRNDLGRVCDYGSVKVSEFMTTEHYSHVIHIVSNVVGTLGPGMDQVALLKAVFPGGTITGAPKVRCMEIIEELEPVRRGIYTGSAGYLSVSGDMDLNILIRTVLAKDGVFQFQTGAGIVADSDPAGEYRETLHKAAAMNRALSGAVDDRVASPISATAKA
jgi:aminodeoxychorismate synthase component I